MWTVQHREIAGRQGEILSVTDDARMLGVREVIGLWRAEEAFRDSFIETLAASAYEAFFWEMPPVDSGTLAHPFECVIIRSGALARLYADDTNFAEHLRGTELVAAFPNLSGDALLIAPRKITNADCYAHIATFVRLAPREQQHALFRCLALEIEKRLAASRERFWVSTSGLGIPWVHVRLDQRPKYYQYGPYR